MKYFLAIFCLLFSLAVQAQQVLNLYAWSGYLPDEVADQFEKETGIHINYATYDSNETMYAKLKANPNAGYDLVIPSTYFIDRMWQQGMLQKIDHKKLVNLNNLNPDLMNKSYDPHNNYSIPYVWGTTAIVVNSKYIDPKSVTSWSDFWQPRFYNKLLLLDDTREIFSMALITMGYSANDTNPEHIKQAYYKLQQLMPNVKLFNDEAIQSIYIDEDATVGMGWGGEIFQAIQENPAIHYIYPKEGFVLWIDSMAIPQGAKNIDSAYKFINFVLRPDIAKKVSIDTGNPSPNLAAIKLMPPEIQHDPVIYPDKATLSRGQLQTDVGAAAEVYEKYMEQLKIGA